MAKTRAVSQPIILPSKTPQQAIPLLKRQLDRADEVLNLRFDAPEVEAWENTTLNILNDVYGRLNGSHKNTADFNSASGGPMFVNMDDYQLQEFHKKQTLTRKALLSAYIEQLTDDIGGPQALEITPDRGLSALERLRIILPRFHKFARQLQRRHSSRATVKIEDEYDVQDLIHSILKLEFDDVRVEEYCPSYAGQNTRMDFLLKEEKIVIEIKKTRDGLADKKLGEELLLDVGRYRAHPDCRILICFIYDPDGVVHNFTGLRNDLEKLGSAELKVEIIISPLD